MPAEGVDVDKVNDRAKTKAVNQIADRAADNKGEGDLLHFIVCVAQPYDERYRDGAGQADKEPEGCACILAE